MTKTMRTLITVSITLALSVGLTSHSDAASARHKLKPRARVVAAAAAASTAPKPTAHITGMVFCTEYGTPYKDSPQILFEGASYKYNAVISNDDGTFYIEVPCGSAYNMRIKFCSRSFGFGKLDVPACKPEGSDLLLQVHYPGSMLEMVYWAESGNGVEGVTSELIDPNAEPATAAAPAMTNTTTTKGE